jgi:hypothetical protein
LHEGYHRAEFRAWQLFVERYEAFEKTQAETLKARHNVGRYRFFAFLLIERYDVEEWTNTVVIGRSNI